MTDYAGATVGSVGLDSPADVIRWSDEGSRLLVSAASGSLQVLELGAEIQIAKLPIPAGRLHDCSWLDPETVLAVGFDSANSGPWAWVLDVESGASHRFELEPPEITGPLRPIWSGSARLECWGGDPPADAALKPVSSSCASSGRVAVRYEQGFTGLTALYRASIAGAVFEERLYKSGRYEPLRLSHRGDFLLPAGRWPTDAIDLDSGNLLRLAKSSRMAANGRCLAALSEHRRLLAWRLEPYGITEWDENVWLDGAPGDILDVVDRAATADILVMDGGALRVERLADPDVLDVGHAVRTRRLRGVRALGIRKDAKAATALAPLLAPDVDPGEREAALRALCATGGEALDVIVTALGASEDDSELREALAGVDRGPLRDCLVRCLRSNSPRRRRGAVTMLADLPGVPATDELCERLNDPLAELRALAITAIGMRADLRAIPALLGSLADDARPVATAAENVLRTTLERCGLLDARVGSRLVKLDGSLLRLVDNVLERGDWTPKPTDPAAESALFDALAEALLDPGSEFDVVLNAIDRFATTPLHGGIGLVLGLRVAAAAERGGRAREAASLYEQAESRAAALDEPAILWHVQMRRGTLAHEADHLRRALGHYADAMATIDRMWSRLLGDPDDRRFFADKAELYEGAVLCQVQLGHSALAIETLERAKTRYLGDLIARRHRPREDRVEREDELFWESIGERRPVAVGAGSVHRGPHEIVSVGVADPAPQAQAPLPRAFWKFLARAAERPALRDGVLPALRGAWLAVAALDDQAREADHDTIRSGLSEIHATLAELREHAPGCQERFTAAAERLVQVPGWELSEYRRALFAVIDREPECDGAAMLDALEEVTGYPGGAVVLAETQFAPEVPSSRNDTWPAFVAQRPSVKRGGRSTQATSALEARTRSRWLGRERIARGETVSFRTVAAALQPKTALVQYALTREGTMTFVASGNATADDALRGWQGPAVFTNRVVTTKWLHDTVVGPWQNAYEQRSGSMDNWRTVTVEALARLYQELFVPIEPWLRDAGVRRLLVVPHRGLHLLPFAAWNDGRRGVLDEYDVHTAPSLTLNDISRRRAVEQPVAARAVIAIHRTGGLTFAGVEASALIGGESDVEPHVSPTRDTFSQRVADAGLVHFSGHGRYDWRDPLASALELADGDLTLASLFDEALPLQAARSVTLAGCETTMTDPMDPADEYLGLSSGFVFGGATAVVSTSWMVEDISMAMLLHRFYRERENGARPSVALGVAQRWMRDKVDGNAVIAFIDEILETGTPFLDQAERRGLETRRRQDASGSRRKRKRRPYVHPTYWGAFTVAGVDGDAARSG